MNKLIYTKEDGMLTQAELADVRCFSLDELEEQDDHFFDYLRPRIFCHFESYHRVVVNSALGVNSTTHTDIFVYSLILGFTGGSEGACYLSAKEIAGLFGYDESVIRKSIKKLLGCKLIKQLPYRIGSPVKTLAAALNHPAYQVGLAWNRGEARARGRALVEDDPRRMQALQFAEILREMAFSATENELSVMFAPGGGINYSELLRLVAEGQTLAEEMNRDAARRTAEEAEKKAPKTVSQAAKRLSEAVLLPAPDNDPKEALKSPQSASELVDLADAPEGYRALVELVSAHNGNKSRWQESVDAYNTLVADGYAPEEILDAWEAVAKEFAGVPDKKWPNVYSYLTGTSSCSSSKGARRRIDAERARKAREAAAAATDEEQRAARAREAAKAAEYEATLKQVIAEDAEYARMDAELMSLISQIKPGVSPGEPGYEAKQRLDELAAQHDARYKQLKAEARRRCGIE